MDADNEVRILRQKVETLEATLRAILDTVERLTDRDAARLNESQEYVPRAGFRDPAVG